MAILNSISDQRIPIFLRHQQVGVIPTDTLYGVVAQAQNSRAVRKLYRIKKREDKPGTVIAASIDQLVELGLKRRYLKAVEHFWPAPISILIPCGLGLEYLHMGRNNLAVRIPGDEDLQMLLEKTGPLLTSSANPPGQKPAMTIAQAQEYFGKDMDFYVDGGDLGNREPSTVIRIVDDAIEVLRAGAVKLDETGKLK